MSAFFWQKTPDGYYVLVIVDMQSQCPNALHVPTIRAVCREVELAKKRGLPIVVVEFPHPHILKGLRAEAEHAFRNQRLSDNDKVHYPVPRNSIKLRDSLTLDVIKKLLDGYEHVEIRQKLDGDGGMAVAYACADRKWNANSFRVVGVNTFGCVLDTVKGLCECRAAARIEVIQDACSAGHNEDLWFKYPEHVDLTPEGGEPEDGAAA